MLFRQVSQVTTVDTDAVAFHRQARFSHLFENADGVRNAGFENIVRIYKKNACFRIQFRIRFKCGVFIRETHDPAVCVGSLDRNIKHLSCQDIGGSDAAADHGSTRAVNAGIRSLRTAKPKFHDAVALCSIDYAGCFRGDQTLVVNHVQNRGFYQLCLHDRSDNF